MFKSKEMLEEVRVTDNIKAIIKMLNDFYTESRESTAAVDDMIRAFQKTIYILSKSSMPSCDLYKKQELDLTFLETILDFIQMISMAVNVAQSGMEIEKRGKKTFDPRAWFNMTRRAVIKKLHRDPIDYYVVYDSFIQWNESFIHIKENVELNWSRLRENLITNLTPKLARADSNINENVFNEFLKMVRARRADEKARKKKNKDPVADFGDFLASQPNPREMQDEEEDEEDEEDEVEK